MTGDGAIRGTRIGSAPSGQATSRGPVAPRSPVSYWCSNGHEARPSFAADAQAPEEWECPKCGLPAGRDQDNPPSAHKSEPYKSHLAYVQERRSESDADALLDEALQRLKDRREL